MRTRKNRGRGNRAGGNRGCVLTSQAGMHRPCGCKPVLAEDPLFSYGQAQYNLAFGSKRL
jgi:hypothetical protein